MRLVVRGWAALTEEVVLDWVRDDRGITREELLVILASSLPAILAPLAARLTGSAGPPALAGQRRP